MAQWLAPFFAYHFNTGDADDKISQAVFASVLTFIVAIVLNFVIALFARRVIAGNLKPGTRVLLSSKVLNLQNKLLWMIWVLTVFLLLQI